MVVTTPPPDTGYLDIFKGYVVASTQRILKRVQQAGPLLPTNDEQQALHTLSYALKLPEAWADTHRLLLTMAPKMEQAGRRDEWIPYLEQGLQQSRQLGDIETEAELHLQLGVLYQLRSKYAEARTQLEASVAGFKQAGALPGQAQALNQLAYVTRRQRHFPEAVRLVEAAQELLPADDQERAFGDYILSLVALDQWEWQTAVELSIQAFDLWESAGNWRMMGRSLLCRGLALQELQRYSDAIKIDELAINLFEKSGDAFLKAIARMNLGIVYMHLGQFEQALTLYRPAEKIFRQVQDRFHWGLVTHNIGFSYRKLGQWTEAKAAYQQSMALKDELGHTILVADDMDGLGLVYLAEGNLTAAQKTFADALARLVPLERDAFYDSLHQMLTEHLQEVTDRLGHQQQSA